MGKIKLQKDISTIRIACKNKIPAVSMDDRSMFLNMLEKQQQSFDEIDNILLSKGKSTNVLHAATSPNSINNNHSPSIVSNCRIVNISSRISIKKATKKSKRKTRSDSSSSSSDTSDSNSDMAGSSSASDLDVYSQCKHTHRSKRKHKRSSKASKKARKRSKIRSRQETSKNENVEKTNTLEIANARFDEIAPRIPSLQSEIPFGGLIHPINVQQQQLLSKPGSALFATQQHVDFTHQHALPNMYVPTAIASADANKSLVQDKEQNCGQDHAATLDDLATIALSRN